MGRNEQLMAMQLAQLKKLIDAGPPPQPTVEEPGPLLRQYCEMVDDVTKGGKELSAPDAASLLAHLIDMNNWGATKSDYEHAKASLERLTRRVIT